MYEFPAVTRLVSGMLTSAYHYTTAVITLWINTVAKMVLVKQAQKIVKLSH
jgi:hypothetical protein